MSNAFAADIHPVDPIHTVDATLCYNLKENWKLWRCNNLSLFIYNVNCRVIECWCSTFSTQPPRFIDLILATMNEKWHKEQTIIFIPTFRSLRTMHLHGRTMNRNKASKIQPKREQKLYENLNHTVKFPLETECRKVWSTKRGKKNNVMPSSSSSSSSHVYRNIDEMLI